MSELPLRRSVVRDASDVVLLLLTGCLILGGIIALLLKWAPGQRLDEDVLKAFRVDRMGQGRIESLLQEIGTGRMLVVTIVVMLVALVQRHWRLAIAIPLLVFGANQSTQLLKENYLTRGDGGPLLPVSMPSGHTTAALSLAVAVVLVAPRVVRPLASLLAGFGAGAAGLGTMAEQWHRPGDVIAAVGVVVIWAALALVVGAEWVHQPLVRPAGFDRAVGHSALAVVGVGLAAWQLQRMGMQPMPGSRSTTLVYGSLIVVGLVIGIGIGLCAVVADRRVHRRGNSATIRSMTERLRNG